MCIDIYNMYYYVIYSYVQCIPMPWYLNGCFIDSRCQQGLEFINSPGIENSWDTSSWDQGSSIARDGQDRHLGPGARKSEKINETIFQHLQESSILWKVLGFITSRKGDHFFFKSPGSEMPLWVHPRTMVLSSMPVTREGPQISCVHEHIQRGSPSLAARQNPRRPGRWNAWADANSDGDTDLWELGENMEKIASL